MADTIQAKYEELEEIDSKLYQIYSNVVEHQRKIVGLSQDLEKHWQGEAADAFVKDSSSFRQSFNMLNMVLLEASYKPGEIAKILHAAEEEAGQRQKAKAL